jgi:hypothetical protein
MQIATNLDSPGNKSDPLLRQEEVAKILTGSCS